MDIINEEEKQFLKTLSRGKRMFERTLGRIEDNILPGNEMYIGYILHITLNVCEYFEPPMFGCVQSYMSHCYYVTCRL